MPADFDPQICSVGGFELLAPHLAERSLVDIIQSKTTTADHPYWDWDTYVASELGVREHPALVDRFERFFSVLPEEGLPVAHAAR